MTKIRTALLAYGASGHALHAPLLSANPSFQLLGALERSSKKISADFPAVKSYTTIDQLLSDDVDLVIVNTPNYTHYEYAMLSLEAGKHVVVEKPFSLIAEEGRVLKAVAEKKGLCLTVFHNRRWDSDFLTVKKIVNEKSLGEISDVEMRFDRFRPLPGPKAHKEGTLPGSGIHYDIGPHLVDQALQLFGRPVKVSADLRCVRPGSLAIDQMAITMHYPSYDVKLFAGFLTPSPGNAYVIRGQKAAFTIQRIDTQEVLLAKGVIPGSVDWDPSARHSFGELLIQGNEKTLSKKISPEIGNYMFFYDQLSRAILKNEALPVTAEEAISVLEILEAAMKTG